MSKFKSQEALDNALIWSIQFKNMDRTRKLIEAGADVHCRGEAACFNAVACDWMELMRLLLEKGVKPKECQAELLGSCAAKSSMEMMELLIREGVRPGFWAWLDLGAAAAHGKWKEAAVLAEEIFKSEKRKGDSAERVAGRVDMVFRMIDGQFSGGGFMVEKRLRPRLKRIVRAAALKTGY